MQVRLTCEDCLALPSKPCRRVGMMLSTAPPVPPLNKMLNAPPAACTQQKESHTHLLKYGIAAFRLMAQQLEVTLPLGAGLSNIVCNKSHMQMLNNDNHCVHAHKGTRLLLML